MRDWLGHHNIERSNLKIKAMVDDWNLITNMVQKEEGYTLCPDFFNLESSKICRIPVNKDIVPRVNLYILQKRDTKKIFPVNKVFKLGLH